MPLRQSWAHFDLFFDRVSFCFISDHAGNIVLANQRLCEFLGLTQTEIIKTNIYKFMPEGIEVVKEESLKREFQFFSKSGFSFWLELNVTPITLSEGAPTQFLWFGFDVTERKSTEQYLADSQLLSKTLMQMAPVGLFLTNAVGSCTYVNGYWSKSSGVPSSKARGNGWQNFIHPEDRDSFMKQWTAFIVGKLSFNDVQYRYIHTNNKAETWVQSSAVVLKDSDGKVTGYLRAEQDITERIQNEKIIVEQRAKIASSSKLSSLGEMAGGIAHEINNPLAVIQMNSSQIQDILEDDSLDKALLKSMASKIESTTQRIAKIVQGLRSFSRDGSKDPFQAISVHKLIEETLSFCSERFKSHGTKLIIENYDRELSIEARETEISQVLLNLLSNAQDAICNLETKWIKLSILSDQNWIEFRVEDSGTGVPYELRSKIFQPFFTTKEIGKGTGLGLSISSGIIQNHNGTLKLDENNPNTCFIIRLPKKHSSSEKVKQAA